jgi:hypothetical protein
MKSSRPDGDSPLSHEPGFASGRRGHGGEHRVRGTWIRLAAMIAHSTVIIFVLMYQLMYEGDHLMFSVNRVLASLVVGAVMTS